MSVYVVNKRTFKQKEDDLTFYVGRPTFFGNPYVIGKDGTREEVVQKYKTKFFIPLLLKGDFYVMYILKTLAAIAKMKNLYLVCWCAPKACHGDVIKEFLDRYNATGKWF